MVNTIAVGCSILWGGLEWQDEAGNLLSFSGTLEMIPPNEAYQSGRQVIQQATLTLANYNARYDMGNTYSDIYPYISGGKLYRSKVIFQVNFNATEYENVFTGYIKFPKYDFVGNKVTFTIWDIGEVLRQKFSTTMLQGYLEHDVVIYYLGLAGLVDGTDFISPTYGAAHALTPTIEASATSIPYSWLDDEPIWDEIAKIAQASGARAYVDRNGMVHYEKAYPWVTPYVYTPETLDHTYIADLVPQLDDKSFYDSVLVEWAARSPGQGSEELWKLPKPQVIQAGETSTIIARFRYPALLLDTPAITATDIGGNVAGSVTVTVDPIYAQQAKITVVNSGSTAAYLSKGKITGIGIHGQPAEQSTQDIGTPTYNRRIDIRGNAYIQSKLQADSIKGFIAWWYGTPKPVYIVRGVQGDPSREIGRRVIVNWVAATSGNNYIEYTKTFIVLKVDFRIAVQDNGAVSYTQDLLLLEDVFTVDNDYFVIGTSTLGGPDVLWY